jgi:divalent metal cation (Fe/Co/Zn/Cd) transporter
MEIVLLEYTYPAYIIGVVVIVELIKHFFNPVLHPKWVTLLVAVGGAIIELVIHRYELDWWKLIISLGIAILGYDYIYKPIKDKVSPNRNQ